MVECQRRSRRYRIVDEYGAGVLSIDDGVHEGHVTCVPVPGYEAAQALEIGCGEFLHVALSDD